MPRIFHLLCLILSFSVSCKTGSEQTGYLSPLASSLMQQPSGTLSIGGAYSLYPMMQVWADSFMAVNKGTKIVIIRDGTGEGLNGLKTGKYDLAMISTAAEYPDTSGELEFLPVVKDAVVPITNRNNPYLREIEERGINPRQFQQLFTSGEKISWGKILDKEYRNEAVIYTRYDRSGTAETWAGFFWKTQADLKGLPAMGEDEMIRKIQSTPLSIGYSSLVNVYDLSLDRLLENIAIVPVDLDFDRVADFSVFKEKGWEEFRKALSQGKYPQTLCRNLSLAFRIENLNPLTNAFLVYILTEGQKFVIPKGFYELNNTRIRNSYLRLEEANRLIPTGKRP